ncbi:neuromedin-U receptor 2-like [Fopius arisanus]|uniref:Neuromedin-U receptor 2-like n=1 Tax=Fopius arisanus TaxID=64838 RepID=A0A9R1T122_9HYME|nr:PREDICTED: neuromedin-U receptor 2-like [Fopius arisanus]
MESNNMSNPANTTEFWGSEEVQLGMTDSSFSHTTRRDPLYLVIPVTIIYLSIFLTGTIGNVCTCIVIARNKSMQTATNYYLFSLAISDLLLLMSGLPAEVYLVWSKYPYIFGQGFCVLRGLAAECSTNASVLTITAFTIERYVAICHPFLSHTISKLSRAIKLILLIWLIALCFAIPQALQFGLLQIPNESPDAIICTLKNVFIQHSFELSTLLFFILPMILITVLYALIGLKLRKTNIMKKTNMRSQRGGLANSRLRDCRYHTGKSSRRVLKMLVAVVIAFFICWAPFHLQRLIAIYGTGTDGISSKTKWFEVLYYIFTYISGVLYYVSTTINPILYNIMSHKFREAFTVTLATTCARSSFSSQCEQRSYSSLSRSQQRTAGASASRTVGYGGVMPQESSDCSANSLKEESRRQSTFVPSQSEIGAAVDSREGSASLELSDYRNRYSVKRIPTIKLNCRDSRCTITSYRTEPSELRQISSSLKGKAISQPQSDDLLLCQNDMSGKTNNDCKNANNYKRNKENYVDTREKKWWNIIRWFPGQKVFKFKSTGANFGEGIADIESKREEYSMTTCYIAKDNRFV